MDTALFTSLFPEFLILAALVFLSPLLSSLLLTKTEPKLKIVPPYWISLVVMGWVLIHWYYPLTPISSISLIFGGLLVLVARAEDIVVTSIIGKAAEREVIFFEHLLVYANIESVKNRLCVPEIRTELALSSRIEGNVEEGYTLRTERGFDFCNRFLLTKDKQYLEEATNLRIAHYQIGRYNLRTTPVFIEHMDKTSGYVERILLYREPRLAFERITPLTNNVQDVLVDTIMDELMGAYAKSKRYSALDKVKIGATISIAVVSVILILIGQSVYGGFSAILDILYALSELPDVVRRSRT